MGLLLQGMELELKMQAYEETVVCNSVPYVSAHIHYDPLVNRLCSSY